MSSGRSRLKVGSTGRPERWGSGPVCLQTSTKTGDTMSLRAILIASTVLYRANLADETPYTQHPFPEASRETVMSPDELTEFAGRSVHASWDRSDPNTATNAEYLRRLRDNGESGPFKHAHATFWVTGASLAFSHELRPVAHALNITEASLRYRALDGVDLAVPPPFVDEEEAQADLEDAFEEAKGTARGTEFALRRHGLSRVQARDGALAFLPLATETTMVVTADMNAWRFVISKSMAADTSAEMYSFGIQVFHQLRQYAPNAVADIEPVRQSRPMLVENGAAPLEEYTECG
jgi:thymidylate synthase (FAD)